MPHYVPTPPSRRLLRRLFRYTMRFLGTSLYYGFLLYLSILEAKLFLCRLCSGYLVGLQAPHFWMLLGLFTVIFTVVNYHVGAGIKRRLLIDQKRYQHEDVWTKQGHLKPKTTRSGCIYGYM